MDAENAMLQLRLLEMGRGTVNIMEYAEVQGVCADSQLRCNLRIRKEIQQVDQDAVRPECTFCDSCGDSNFGWWSYCHTCGAASPMPIAKPEDDDHRSWSDWH